MAAPDPNERLIGEIPPPRPGVRSYEELKRVVKDERVRADLEADEHRARLSRIRSPGTLFAHYTDAEAALRYILPERRIRLSAFARMRDPRENKDWVAYGVRTRVGSSASLEGLDDALNAGPQIDLSEATLLANRARRQQHTKILSLTREPPERSPYEDFTRAYARPRMWDQYGEGHAGVCLVFDVQQLHHELSDALAAHGSWWHGPVAYDNEALVENATRAFRLDGNRLLAVGGGDLQRGLVAHLEEHHRTLFFTKMRDYSDEQEYRYVLLDGRDDDYAYVNIGASLLAIVLGEAFNGGLERAKSAATDVGIAIRQMAWGLYGPVALPLANA